jgi:hypothetical protein
LRVPAAIAYTAARSKSSPVAEELPWT